MPRAGGEFVGQVWVPTATAPAHPVTKAQLDEQRHDASHIVSGVLDPARIPVLPSQRQVVSAGGIANLTDEQQAQVGQGTVVTTTDGRRWVYTGAGSKTAEASYVELADITPEWAAITNKPATFAPTPSDVLAAVAGATAAAPADGDLPVIAGPSGTRRALGGLAALGAIWLGGAAGAVSRALGDKLADLPSLRDLGGLDDNETDNHDAILAALLWSATYGRPVHLFPTATGVYKSSYLSFYGRSGYTLILWPGTTLMMIDDATPHASNPFINISGGSPVSDCRLIVMPGATIARPGGYGDGEQRHLISIGNAVNVRLGGGGRLAGSGGDGVYIGLADSAAYPLGVTLDDLELDTHRRQGVSVTSGDRIVLRDLNVHDISGTGPSAAVDIEPNAGQAIGAVDIWNLRSRDCDGAALLVYPWAGNTGNGCQVRVNGLRSQGDAHGIRVGRSKDRTAEMVVHVRDAVIANPTVDAVMLDTLGQGLLVDIEATAVLDNGKPVVRTYRQSGYTDTVSGMPKKRLKLTIAGSSIGPLITDELLEGVAASASQQADESGDSLYALDNPASAVSLVQANVGFRGRITVANRRDDKTYAGSGTITRTDTYNATRLIRANFSSSGPSNTTLTIDENSFRAGNRIAIRNDGQYGAIIASSTGKLFLPGSAPTLQTSQIGARVTLEKNSSDNWEVSEMIGTWTVS
jgi:hypothetical protein